MARQRNLSSEVSQGFEKTLAGLEQNTRVLRALADSVEEHRREFREEYEAQRGTLLAILDRLDLIDPREGGGTAPAA